MKTFTLKFLSIAALILGLGLAGQPALAHNGEVHTASTTPHSHEMMDHSMHATSSTMHGYNVIVMKHLCNSNVKNMNDFHALEAGKDPVAALANTVLNCPTTGLPGDMAVAGTVASPRTTYDFKVMGEHHGAKMLATDGMFMAHKLSEADINKDVDGNGTISASTALDISHYEFPNLMADNGRVEVTETMPPAGYRFGALRFTPPVVDNNNDQQSLIGMDEAQGRIQLDLTNDKDKTVMLHVYNFRTDAGTTNTSTSTGSTGTTTPTTDRAMIISQINSLQQQINSLFAQIQTLLGRL